MKTGDLIELIRAAEHPEPGSNDYVVIKLPKVGDILTCRGVAKDSHGKYGVLVEEYTFGYYLPTSKELLVALDKWRVIEPMSLKELFKEEIKN